MVHSKLVLTQVIKNMISCEEMKDQYVRTLDEGLRFRHGFIFISFHLSKMTGIGLKKYTTGRHRTKMNGNRPFLNKCLRSSHLKSFKFNSRKNSPVRK